MTDTPTCAMPGCVAGSVKDGLCFVHATGGGFPCPHCKGSGMRFYSGQNATMPCLDCGGVGLIDRRVGGSRGRRKDDPVDRRGLIASAEVDL